MNWRGVVAAVAETQKEQFTAWTEGEEGTLLNIGDEGTQLTEEQRQDYVMLIYAFKDIIAVNPKAPGVIKGMRHRIPFLDGVDTTPWQEYARVGSPAEEEIKDREILSATRTPPAPSIIQFRGGRYWFQLGKHTPQRTARAILKAAFPFYNQRSSRTAPGHTPGAPPRRWERCSGIKPGLKRQHAPGVPVAARGSAHP